MKGTSNGGYYPFKVTTYMHDCGAGYPANRYYGQTCLRKMEAWKFDMRKDDFGEWIVQGRFTVMGEDAVCKENPSEGARPFRWLVFQEQFMKQAKLCQNLKTNCQNKSF